jgi:hypothetical protein
VLVSHEEIYGRLCEEIRQAKERMEISPGPEERANMELALCKYVDYILYYRIPDDMKPESTQSKTAKNS